MQHDRPVPHEYVVVNATRFQVHDVADHTPIADHGRDLGRGVQDRTVLDTRRITDPDLSLVTPENGTRPHRTLGSDGHRSDDDRIGVDERGTVDRRLRVTERVDGHSVDTSASGPGGGTVRCMPRRIDIELTSALGDGSWTWRAAGAKQPKGVLDGGILPAGASVGDQLKVEVEQEIDGITVLEVVHGRAKAERDDRLELLPTDREFQAVIETRARRDRGERRDRGDRRPRRDSDRGERRDRRPNDDRPRTDGDRQRNDGDRPRTDGDRQRRDRGQRRGPSFTPPPEVPQRPKPKRLKPGKSNRTAVLAELPEEQRPIAELALQGLAAVRTRLKEDNARAASEGRPVMPEASVLAMAEKLLPRLRVAEWQDRAEAAKRQMEHLDLRDLRSVVAASDDPMVARDESTRALASDLKAALATRQEQELQLWFGDVDAALAVGRVIRALRLSSQPPKAGVPFPVDIAQRLVDSINAALAPMDPPERWIALLEAAAFAPIRAQVRPTRRPDVVNDELLATVKRLAPALPTVAALFEIEVDPKAPMPKPLRTPMKPRPNRTESKPGNTANRDRKPEVVATEPVAAVEETPTEPVAAEPESTPTHESSPEAEVQA